MKSVQSIESDELFNSPINNQKLWLHPSLFGNDGTPLCFTWEQVDNSSGTFIKL